MGCSNFSLKISMPKKNTTLLSMTRGLPSRLQLAIDRHTFPIRGGKTASKKFCGEVVREISYSRISFQGLEEVKQKHILYSPAFPLKIICRFKLMNLMVERINKTSLQTNHPSISGNSRLHVFFAINKHVVHQVSCSMASIGRWRVCGCAISGIIGTWLGSVIKTRRC